jgi:ubiquinone/menaquinone biosynthesis C-methylase UbiE
MPTKDELAAEWEELAPAWIERIRGKGDESREHLLDEWMLRAVGEVRDQRVIDLGCGEGRFCRMLAERGAHITGVDLSAKMIAAANAHRISDEQYLVADMEHLHELADGSFNLAVSYITLVDLHDLGASLREAFRVLRPSGRFIVCNLASMVTAGNRWLRDEQRNKICFYLDNYFDESRRSMQMCGGAVSNAHRTLATYLNGFISAGFMLEGIEEPYPSEKQLEACPSNADILRVPLFVIYRLRKPALSQAACP